MGDGGNALTVKRHMVVGIVASIGATVSLFFATAVFSDDTALEETQMGAT
jgi:Na+/H+ antiporter NhaA